MSKPLRVISLNANGLRSAASKGFLTWLADQEADVCCLQEIRVAEKQIHAGLQPPPGWHARWLCAERPGYAGVAIWSRTEPKRLRAGIGDAEFDAEGRVLTADYPGLRVVSLYLPSGSSSDERQRAKFRFMELFESWLKRERRARTQVLVCGDWNIAHTEKDLKNWRANRDHSGFLPEERTWLGRVFDSGWSDVFRRLHPDAEGEGYTWWSNRGQARAKNVGWRIDYQVASPALAERALTARVHREDRFSDHAPLIADYDLQIPGYD